MFNDLFCKQDALICITYEDIITTAHANGETPREAFEEILDIAIEDTRALFEQHEAELEEMI